MHRYQVLFKDTKDVSDFVNIAMEYSMDMDIVLQRQMVDGKSFLGIASLLSRYRSEPLCLACAAKNPEFERRITRFLAA